MSKKISKKASAVRTISLAVGSLSLLVIAATHITDKNKNVCSNNLFSNETQIRLS